MKNDNFEIQNSLEANYLIVKYEQDMDQDEIAVKVLQEDIPDFLVPIKTIRNNEQFYYRYKVNLDNAWRDLELALPKSLFVKLFLNVISPFIKVKDWLLDYHCICIDPKYVFLDQDSYEVQYIYVPEKSIKVSDLEINQFLEETVKKITITDDKNLYDQLCYYFEHGHVVLMDIYQMLKKEETQYKLQKRLSVEKNQAQFQQPSQPQQIQQQQIQEMSTTDEQQSLKKEKDIPQFNMDQNSSDDDIMQALFGNNDSIDKKKAEKKEFHILPQLHKKADKEESFTDERETDPIIVERKQDIIKPGVTEILFDEVRSGVDAKYLELLHSPIPGAPQRIPLIFPGKTLLIGRISSDEQRPDIVFNAEFKRIGRKHAVIEKKQDDLYIIDLGSANHTLINGRIMTPNTSYLLKNDDKISFTASMPVEYVVVK